MTLFATPTMRLLNSSTVVAIAGGLRLNIAFLLAGLEMRIPEYIAFALIIYATYLSIALLTAGRMRSTRANLLVPTGISASLHAHWRSSSVP